MLKKILHEGERTGSYVGFVSGAVYCFIAYFVILSDLGGVPGIPVGLLSGLTFALVFSAIASLLGGLTGAVFGLVFQKFRGHRLVYVLLCVSFCIAVAVLINLLLWRLFSLSNVPQLYSEEWLVRQYLIKLFIAMAGVPGVLYVIIGIFSSIYLFNKFKTLEENAVSPAS
jgi:hypothetical protein